MHDISQILPSAVAALTHDGATNSLRLPNSTSVVVLLIDGMGFENLIQAQAWGIETSTLTSSTAIEATFPTTTPVSLASLGTGLKPGSHGFVGATFLIPELGVFLQPLKWTDTPNALMIQPEPTWFENALEVGCAVTRIGPGAYSESGLTRAALRGGKHVSAETLGELVLSIQVALSGPQQHLIYAYYPNLDKIGHVHGVDSDEWRAEMALVADAITRVQALLGAGQTLVVTADHGMIDIAERYWIEDSASLMRDVRFITGEPRMRHVFAQPGYESSLLRAWRSVENIADVYSRDEFIATTLMGEVESEFLDRIGDVVAIARDGFSLASRTIDERVSNLIGNHGAWTSTERLIPCAVMAG